MRTKWKEATRVLGVLIVMELVLGLLVLLQAAPAFMSDVWNTDVTFPVESDLQDSGLPLKERFGGPGPIESIECDVAESPRDAEGDHVRCRFTGTGSVFDVQSYLAARGITTANVYANYSSWPRQGGLTQVLWQFLIGLAALLLWLRRQDGLIASLQQDISRAWMALRSNPFLFVLPFSASAAASSASLMVFEYARPALSALSGGGDVGFLVVVTTVLIAPLLEEAVFRGHVYDILSRRMRWWLASILGSLSFASMHSISMLNANNGPIYFMGLFAAGIALCFVRKRTGSVTACILAHALANLVALLIQVRQSAF